MLKENLKKLRENRKLTKKAVADGVGISERAYIAYEYGERDVSTETLSKLADFYHVTTDYLLGRETGEPNAIDKLTNEFNMSLLEQKILENYLALPDDMRDDLMEFLNKSVREVMEESNINNNEVIQNNDVLTDEDIERELKEYKKELILEKNQKEKSSVSEKDELA